MEISTGDYIERHFYMTKVKIFQKPIVQLSPNPNQFSFAVMRRHAPFVWRFGISSTIEAVLKSQIMQTNYRTRKEINQFVEFP